MRGKAEHSLRQFYAIAYSLAIDLILVVINTVFARSTQYQVALSLEQKGRKKESFGKMGGKQPLPPEPGEKEGGK